MGRGERDGPASGCGRADIGKLLEDEAAGDAAAPLPVWLPFPLLTGEPLSMGEAVARVTEAGLGMAGDKGTRVGGPAMLI